MSSTESIRQLVSQTTGVPAELISGETVEEMQAHANMLKDFRQANISAAPSAPDQEPKSNADLFSDWMNQSLGRVAQPETMEAAAESMPVYPTVRDGGEIITPTHTPSTADLFAECLASAQQVMAWQPVGLRR